MPAKDPEKQHPCRRERDRRLAAERVAAGFCPKCGAARPEPERRMCAECNRKRREADRARYARAKAEGRLYGNADKDLMPSEVPEPADFRGFPADSLGINPGRHLPPRMRMRLSVASGKAPGWIEGGALSARISSFSARLARR